MRKHSFPLYNSLLLINAFLKTANSLDEIYKRRINKNDCSRKQTKGNCEMLGRILAKPDAWFKLNKDEKDRLKRFSGVDYLNLKVTFHSGAARSNLTGFDLDPRNAKYSIYYMQRSDEAAAFKAWPSKFGHWTPSKGTHIRPSRILEIEDELANISSSCPRTCPPGTYEVATFANYARRCCWKTCVPCTGKSFSNSSNSSECTECKKGHLPSKDHTMCHIVFQASETDRSSAVSAGFFAAIGFGIAALTLIQFYRHRCEFIVKSSDYMLSMGMLFFFAISFLSVALLLVEPSNFTCKSRVVAVLPWPVLYVGCILIKTNRLRVLFRHSSKLSTRKILLLRNKTQGFFVISLAFVTAAFLFLWVALDSIEVRFVYYEDYSEKACSLSNTWMGVYFGGTLSLLVASLFLASLTHSLPADYNEASFLLLATGGTTFFWIILIPAYYVSTSVRSDTLLALILTSQGLVTMFCLFTRRLYYIIRPMSEAEVKSRRMISRSFRKCSRRSSMWSMRGQTSPRASVRTLEFGVDVMPNANIEERSQNTKSPALSNSPAPAVRYLSFRNPPTKPSEVKCACAAEDTKL